MGIVASESRYGLSTRIAPCGGLAPGGLLAGGTGRRLSAMLAFWRRCLRWLLFTVGRTRHGPLVRCSRHGNRRVLCAHCRGGASADGLARVRSGSGIGRSRHRPCRGPEPPRVRADAWHPLRAERLLWFVLVWRREPWGSGRSHLLLGSPPGGPLGTARGSKFAGRIGTSYSCLPGPDGEPGRRLGETPGTAWPSGRFADDDLVGKPDQRRQARAGGRPQPDPDAVPCG